MEIDDVLPVRDSIFWNNDAATGQAKPTIHEPQITHRKVSNYFKVSHHKMKVGTAEKPMHWETDIRDVRHNGTSNSTRLWLYNAIIRDYGSCRRYRHERAMKEQCEIMQHPRMWVAWKRCTRPSCIKRLTYGMYATIRLPLYNAIIRDKGSYRTYGHNAWKSNVKSCNIPECGLHGKDAQGYQTAKIFNFKTKSKTATSQGHCNHNASSPLRGELSWNLQRMAEEGAHQTTIRFKQ